MTTEHLVQEARKGNKEALAQLISAVQDDVYYLALRMLAEPEDARDAAQEILIKVVTKLSTFEGRSAFRTWVYRIATNHLLTARKLREKELGLTFADFKEDLERDLEAPAGLQSNPEYNLLVNEVRLGCTLAMLLCLNPKHRLAYILGDIFELDHTEASDALGISKATYRQQLARARHRVIKFTQQSCGLVSSSAACQCDHRLHSAIRRNRVQVDNIQFAAASPESYAAIRARLAETTNCLRTLKLQQAVPHFKSPAAFGHEIQALIEREFPKR